MGGGAVHSTIPSQKEEPRQVCLGSSFWLKLTFYITLMAATAGINRHFADCTLKVTLRGRVMSDINISLRPEAKCARHKLRGIEFGRFTFPHKKAVCVLRLDRLPKTGIRQEFGKSTLHID